MTALNPYQATDRLRAVRVAVLAGQFRDALRTLAELPIEVRASADALLFRSMALWRTGEYVESAALAREAGRRFRAAGDSDGTMRSENVAAAADFALGQLADARVGFTRALSLADTLGDDLMIARCANNLGNIDYYLAEYSRALSSYGLAEASFEKVGWRKGLTEVSLNRSIVFRERGELHASIVDGDRAIDYAEAEQDRRLVGQGLATRAETRAHLHDFEVATVEAHRAYRLAVAEVNPLDEADALRVRCVIERLRRNPTEAVRFGESALDIVRPLGHAWTTAESERDLAEAYSAMGRSTDAITCLESAGQALRQMGAIARVEAVEKKLEDLRGPS